MAEPDDKARLDALSKRIAAARAKEEKPLSAVAKGQSQAQVGWQMVTELVAGILIGSGMGYGLDKLFGTMPWFLIGLTLLGFAAGVNVMLRTAKGLTRNEDSGQPPGDEGKTDGR